LFALDRESTLFFIYRYSPFFVSVTKQESTQPLNHNLWVSFHRCGPLPPDFGLNDLCLSFPHEPIASTLAPQVFVVAKKKYKISRTMTVIFQY